MDHLHKLVELRTRRRASENLSVRQIIISFVYTLFGWRKFRAYFARISRILPFFSRKFILAKNKKLIKLPALTKVYFKFFIFSLSKINLKFGTIFQFSTFSHIFYFFFFFFLIFFLIFFFFFFLN